MNSYKLLCATVAFVTFLGNVAFAQENSSDEAEFLVEESIQEGSDSTASVEEKSDTIQVPSYTWDQFLKGEKCQDQINFFKKLDFLSPEDENLLSQMKRYCAPNKNVWTSLLTTFRQNKRTLLVYEAAQEKSFLTRYLFKAFYSLVDVHKQFPEGKSVQAQLDRIENALLEKNLEQIIDLLGSFSTEQIVFMKPFLNEVEQLIQFKESL